jgi:hypothetical protein
MAIDLKSVVDVIKPFLDFIVLEIPKFVRNLAFSIGHFGKPPPYKDVRSAVVGNVCSSILTALSMGLMVIIYVHLFFPDKLQYNLDGRFLLGGLSIISVNLLFAFIYFSIIHRNGKLKSEANNELAWKLSLSSNIFDFAHGLAIPPFVLMALDFYYYWIMGTQNPLDVSCSLPSAYLPLGIIPIAAIRLFMWLMLFKYSSPAAGEIWSRPLIKSAVQPSFGATLLIVSVIYAFVQALLMRAMLLYSIYAFDPC